MSELKGKGSHHKKHKHKKKKSHKREKSSSLSEVESDEMEWVESAPSIQATQSKRDDWMNAEMFVSTINKESIRSGSSREKKMIIQQKEKDDMEAIRNQRELNPYLRKDNPKDEDDVSVLRLPSSSTGDGGYGYLKKAYLRIQEQSAREGRSMEDIAVERWGSLDKLLTMIEEAEVRIKSHSENRIKSHTENRMKHRRDDSPERHSRYMKPPSDHTARDSFQYRKPERHDNRRSNYFSSSSHKRSSRDWSPKSDSHKHSRGSSDSRKKFSEKRTDSPPSPVSERKSPPSPVSERKLPQSPVSERKSPPSPGSERKSPSRQALERGASSRPAWKKPKPLEEKETHSCADSHRESAHFAENSSLAITSEDDLNKLAARYLKADLMGDSALAAKLKSQLDAARQNFRPSATRTQEKVLLTKMDSSGQQQPVQSSREEGGFKRRSQKEQKGRNKHFDDTSKYSLKQMFEREKLTTVEDNIEMFIDVSAENKELDDENETCGISKKASGKMDHTQQEEKDIRKAMMQHQKLSAALERCEYCLDQPNMKSHLIVKMLQEVLLCIPHFECVTDGHCLIVPKRHVPSFRSLDEDEWRSFEDAKQLLRNFFKKQGKSVVCIETSMFFGRCPHAIVECIPIPEEDAYSAPMYFKKAILESEEEWAHNVKLVDLTAKNLLRSVPKSLPYFCVWFDPSIHAGYAHIIEDEKCFPRNFGKEVIGGMLDIDYNHLYKNRKDDLLKKSKIALEFSRMLEKSELS